jgi:hypothetical protein
MNLLSQISIDKVKDSTSNGTSDVVTSIVDMANYEGVVFITNIATPAANNGIKAQQGQDSGMSDSADLAGTLLQNASAGDLRLEIHKPAERYLTATVKRGTSTVVGEIWAIRYGRRTMPDAVFTAGTKSKTFVSPDQGTA